MATLGATALSYADWAKRLDDNYKIAMIIELLSLRHHIFKSHHGIFCGEQQARPGDAQSHGAVERPLQNPQMVRPNG